MARPLRIEFPGAVYHVTSRGDRREATFDDDEDAQGFLAVLRLAGLEARVRSEFCGGQGQVRILNP